MAEISSIIGGPKSGALLLARHPTGDERRCQYPLLLAERERETKRKKSLGPAWCSLEPVERLTSVNELILFERASQAHGIDILRR